MFDFHVKQQVREETGSVWNIKEPNLRQGRTRPCFIHTHMHAHTHFFNKKGTLNCLKNLYFSKSSSRIESQRTYSTQPFFFNQRFLAAFFPHLSSVQGLFFNIKLENKIKFKKTSLSQIQAHRMKGILITCEIFQNTFL